jgi:putative two-component system hydrogenase maturation factor HypX/HoxX
VRVLFLTHAFNSLTQRLYAELSGRNHEVSIEFDIADIVAEEAVAQFQPDLIVAPFLKRAIPASIWSRLPCLVVHPGIVGDRGPSALDWAIQEGEERWGVTVLQAEAEMDAGPVWASAEFPLRRGKKASVYRNEVTEAACRAMVQALERMPEYLAGRWAPKRLVDAAVPARGRLRPLMKQAERAIDWRQDDSASVLRKIDAGDGVPGVADLWFGVPCHVFDAWPETRLRGVPGEVIARRETALLRATRDGAVWVGHARRADGIKLPATLAFATEAAAVPEVPLDGWWAPDHATWQDIRYEEANGVGFLHFEFYNGAMGTRHCQRLQAAFEWAQTRPTRVIVLAGGADFWSNGIHLNLIENAASAADESWANINAIDDLAEAILRCAPQLTVAALAGNTGAGGCFLARAADQVWVRAGVMLNPHYKNMGNLYGSEFWTYLLPPRVGADGARNIMQRRLPMTARQAVDCGFYDQCIEAEQGKLDIRDELVRKATELAAADDYPAQLAAKRARRAADEAAKPLTEYRAEELAQMRRNFYGFDPSYHYARHHFVHKVPHAWTPRHLARHRDKSGERAA